MANLTLEQMIEIQRRMMRIRLFDERASKMVKRGHIPGTVHTSIGQEAQVVGSTFALADGDYMSGNHRSHGHPIGKGSPLGPLMAELVGKACEGHRVTVRADCGHGCTLTSLRTRQSGQTTTDRSTNEYED